MKRQLLIVADNCGEKLCSSAPGKFCSHLLTKRMGTMWICGIFRNDDGSEIELQDTKGDGTGSLMRCAPCLAADRGVPDGEDVTANNDDSRERGRLTTNLGGRLSDLVASVMAFSTEGETGPALEQRALEIEAHCNTLKRDVWRAFSVKD